MSKKKDGEPSPLMTAAEVARLARVTPEAVKRWRESGKIPFVYTPGGKVRYRRDTVEALFAAAAERVGGGPRASPAPEPTTRRQRARDERTDALLEANGQRG